MIACALTMLVLLVVALTPGAVMLHNAGGMFPWLKEEKS